MAELFRRTTGEVSLGCYSERGLMSYFMFRVLPTRLVEFLQQTTFANGFPNPIQGVTHPEDVTLFSELDFGNEGFGKPDGAIWLRHQNRSLLILIEVKLNQSYRAACGRNASYNSTIQGQLELKWRLMRLFKSGSIQDVLGVHYVVENSPMIEAYRDRDRMYRCCTNIAELGLDGRRRLRLVNGVGCFFREFVEPCALEDIFYLTLTVDPTNPFDTTPEFRPRCFDEHGQQVPNAMSQFAWVSTSVLAAWQ